MRISSKDFRVPEGDAVNLKKVADKTRASLQVEGAIQRALGRTCRLTEFTTAAALRVQSLCSPTDLSGNGCRRKRRRHQARHVRRQPARLPGVQLQTSQRRRIGTRFSVAHRARLPERGKIGIFNPSYYEEVQIVRVHSKVSAQRTSWFLASVLQTLSAAWRRDGCSRWYSARSVFATAKTMHGATKA